MFQFLFLVLREDGEASRALPRRRGRSPPGERQSLSLSTLPCTLNIILNVSHTWNILSGGARRAARRGGGERAGVGAHRGAGGLRRVDGGCGCARDQMGFCQGAGQSAEAHWGMRKEGRGAHKGNRNWEHGVKEAYPLPPSQRLSCWLCRHSPPRGRRRRRRRRCDVCASARQPWSRRPACPASSPPRSRRR